MPLNKNIIDKYVSNKSVFVETGSWLGHGIEIALNCGFEEIISIELAEKYFNICNEKFKNNKNVKIILGDSCEVLFNLIEEIDKPITFWLDGHYSGADTGFGKFEYPLIQELEQIKKHKDNTHIILIDDMRLFRNKKETLFDVNNIIEKIITINENYKIFYGNGHTKNDILIAKI